MLHHRFYDWLTRNQTFAVEWAPLLANTHSTLTSNEGKFFHIDLWLPFYISWCIQVTDQAARLKAKYFVLYRWIQWTFITSSKSNWFGTIPISKCTTTFYRTEQTCDSQLMHDLKKECFKNTNEFRCVYKPIDVRIVYISKETIVLGTFHLLECLFHAWVFFSTFLWIRETIKHCHQEKTWIQIDNSSDVFNVKCSIYATPQGKLKAAIRTNVLHMLHTTMNLYAGGSTFACIMIKIWIFFAPSLSIFFKWPFWYSNVLYTVTAYQIHLL